MLKVYLSFRFFNMLAFNLISFLFMSSSLSTKICINWSWKYFWIAILNFSIILLVIFITTTWFDEAMALVFLGRWLISEISPNIEAAFSSVMVMFSGSCSDIWFSLTSTLVFFWISIFPVIITKNSSAEFAFRDYNFAHLEFLKNHRRV